MFGFSPPIPAGCHEIKGRKNVYCRLVDCINHCNINNVTIIFIGKNRPLERLVVVCSDPLSIYMGRWGLGRSLWPNPLGILLAALPFLRIDLCFAYGRSHITKAAPYQARGYRASPSGKRSLNHNGRSPGCLFLDFSGGPCHGAGVSLSEIANEIKKEAAQEKLKEFKGSGEDAWEDPKAGVELAWDSLGEAVKSAASRFK